MYLLKRYVIALIYVQKFLVSTNVFKICIRYLLCFNIVIPLY